MKPHYFEPLIFQRSGFKTQDKFTFCTVWGLILNQIFGLSVTLGHCWNLPKNTRCIWRNVAKSRSSNLRKQQLCFFYNIQSIVSRPSSHLPPDEVEWLLGGQGSLPTPQPRCSPCSSEMAASSHSLPSRSTIQSCLTPATRIGFNLHNAGGCGLCWPFSWKVLLRTYNFVNNSSRKMVCSEACTAETHVQNPFSWKIIELGFNYTSTALFPCDCTSRIRRFTRNLSLKDEDQFLHWADIFRQLHENTGMV